MGLDIKEILRYVFGALYAIGAVISFIAGVIGVIALNDSVAIQGFGGAIGAALMGWLLWPD